MIIPILLGLILWFVIPLLIESRVKRKSDRRAYQLLSKIIGAALILFSIYNFIVSLL